MSDQSKITHVWDEVWKDSDGDPASYLQDRFTKEAYAAFRPVVGARGQAVLEAGCGTGRFCCLIAQDFPENTVTGVDVSAGALAIARRLSATLGSRNATFVEGSIFALPFPDNQFDLVFNEGVVQLFDPLISPTQAEAVKEMARVTKPGGRVMISVTNWYNWPHTLYKALLPLLTQRGYELEYEKSYRPAELRRLMTAQGLRDIALTGFYPSYGFYRLSHRAPRSRPLTHRLGHLVDQLENPWLRRHFGFELVAVGTK